MENEKRLTEQETEQLKDTDLDTVSGGGAGEKRVCDKCKQTAICTCQNGQWLCHACRSGRMRIL